MIATKHEPIRIVLADDHPSTRESLRSLLNAEPDLDAVGVAREWPSRTSAISSAPREPERSGT